MDAGKQQIIGYFIEEAREHLYTIERGLLNLQSVMQNQERVNEMFRAAHSIKGGAAMLGFDGIQKLAHRMEDCFKILKEEPVQVDQQLESLFLGGFDTLKELLERLQAPFGLREEDAERIVRDAEPLFQQLQAHLVELPRRRPVAATTQVNAAPAVSFSSQVMGVLKQMLALFKQQDTSQRRQQLLGLCDRLWQLGQGVRSWEALVRLAKQAIANSNYSFRTLAPVIIKELKEASDMITAGQAGRVAPSPALQQLALAQIPPRQISIALEPRAAAATLVKAFKREQLLELIRLLQQATTSSR